MIYKLDPCFYKFAQIWFSQSFCCESPTCSYNGIFHWIQFFASWTLHAHSTITKNYTGHFFIQLTPANPACKSSHLITAAITTKNLHSDLIKALSIHVTASVDLCCQHCCCSNNSLLFIAGQNTDAFSSQRSIQGPLARCKSSIISTNYH